ncbi:hypothetical protein [Lacipirellula limnantheis]|uniref:Uncharacterized protein n=1 Tax=Lacipirellula limnantheis TaxID=2528024 RepID=A0A517U2Q0_9BACT|nr:hypothetical protein [Lacipirellula limnantheis]QDT74901.1 hypothetical protein I41_41050 [Lacipirellula limnantheis]
MRSVFFNLTRVTRQEVAAFFYEIAEANGPEAWRWPVGAESASLYLGFYDDLLAEAEDEDLIMLREVLGSLPDVSVVVNVSGRIPGEAEVWEISRLVLNQFQGVAWDDAIDHCWTLAEIESNALFHGHRFFVDDDLGSDAGWHVVAERRHVRVTRSGQRLHMLTLRESMAPSVRKGIGRFWLDHMADRRCGVAGESTTRGDVDRCGDQPSGEAESCNRRRHDYCRPAKTERRRRRWRRSWRRRC